MEFGIGRRESQTQQPQQIHQTNWITRTSTTIATQTYEATEHKNQNQPTKPIQITKKRDFFEVSPPDPDALASG